MPSSMRFAGVNQYQPSDASITTEAYSLGVQPVVRFGIMTDNSTFGFTNAHAKMSMGIITYSSDGTKAAAYWADRLEDGTAFDPSWVGNTGEGPGFIADNADTIYRQSVVSADTNNLYVQRALTGFEFPNTVAYHANVWAGSFSSAPAQGNLSDVVSSALTLTYGFQPDLIFAFGQYGAPAGAFETAVWRYTIGVWDCVNSKAQFMGAMAWTFSNTYRYPVVHSDKGWFNARFNPVGFRSAIYLGSVGATGATFVVNTAYNTSVVTTGLTTNAFKFHDTGVHWKLNHKYVDASTTGLKINTIQTNSLIPLWGYFMGSQMRSMDTIGSSADPANGNFGIGFWTGTSNADGQATILIEDERFNQNNANFVGNTTFLNIFDFVGGTTWYCRSGQSGDNGFSFSAGTNTPADHDGSVLQYLLIGDSVDAPSHLMDASSSSIFLADASDYDDNLLLVASAAAAPAVTSTTFRAGTFQSLVSTAAQAEPYALDGALPKVRVHEHVMGTTGTNTTQAAYRASLGTAVFSSDGLGKTYATHAFRNQDAVASPNRDGALVTDAGGSFLSATGDTEFLITVGSVAADQANIKVSGGANSYGYNAYVFAGSISAENGLSTVLANSTGQAAICSMSFKPDLIYVLGNFSSVAAANSESVGDTQGFGYGFYDVRSTFGRYLNHTYYNDTTDVPQHHVASTMGRIVPALFTAEYDVASVGDAGFYIKCVAANTIDGRTHRFGFMGIKFDDPTIKFKLVDYTGPLSSGVQSFGFDFCPKFVHFLGTTTATLGYLAQTNDVPAGNAMTQGFWSQSGDLGASFSFVEGGTGTTDARVGFTNSAMALFRAGLDEPPELASIGSVTIQGSTALNFYTNVFTTTGQNFKGFMLVIGPNEQAAAGGGNTPTMKFGQDTYLVSTLDTVETYSELTGVPQFRFSMMTGTSQLNAVDDDGRISIGMMAISSDLTKRSVVTAYRNQDGAAGAVLANYHLVGSTNGPGVISPSAASFVTETEVQSVGSGLIRNKALTGAGSYGFASFSWTGSLYSRVGQLAAPVNIANVGSAEIFSTDITPQLLFMSISHTNTGNGFKSTGYDENTLTFGFYDTRSSLGRYINFGHSGAGADTVMAFLSDQMVKVNCGDDGIGNYWMDVASVSASGLFVKVTSVPLALSDRTQVAISAISFLDSATNYKIGDFVLPTSSEAASIAFDFTPRFAMFLATDNKSINCIPASEGSFGRGDGFSIGFWSNSTEMSYAAYNQQGAASGVNNKTILGNSVAARITQGDNALIAEIGSVTATSDSLVFYSDVFTTVGQATRMSYLVIGDSQAAAPGSSGPGSSGATGALFRKFPDTDDRQFPTPLTNVRAFPSD